MKLPRRTFLHLAAGAAALPEVLRIAWAQAYPTRPVRVVVGQAAGSGSDAVARLIGQFLSERFGQQFVIENRPGAAGNIATEAVVRSPPDGYTLLLVNTSSAIDATLYDKKINMASAGIGSAHHLFGELFKMMAGVEMVHVPYRGSTPALTDLLGGRVQVMFDATTSSLPHISSGKLRPLAVTTATRSELLPDIPTIGDFVPGYEAHGWIGFGAPKNTPAAVVDRLNNEINSAISDSSIKARLIDLGGLVLPPSSPADFGKLIADETEKWAKVIRAANIKPE